MMHQGEVQLQKPREFNGHLDQARTRSGVWKGRTRPGSKDACILSTLPLYSARHDSPRSDPRGGSTAQRTIYYEVRLHSFRHASTDDQSSLALGFCAMPYPTFRLPGWQRGSLAVHGDDGHRFVNDLFGGKHFTAPFKAGDTLGLGMTFSLPANPPSYSASYSAPAAAPSSLDVKIFFTRNGSHDGAWDLHEELDVGDLLGVEGLDGAMDVYPAVGVYGSVEFEVRFASKEWLCKV